MAPTRTDALQTWPRIGKRAGNPFPQGTIMNIDAIPIGKSPPDDLNVIIEVPLGGEPIKYEIDKASGALFVDRFLYTPMRYPGNYGFVPHTLCGDGDPLDVIVMNSRPLVPGAVVRCRPFGVLFMEDDGGTDEKILAVPVSKLTKMYDGIHDITDMQPIQLERVKHFFTHYKDLEPGKWAKIEKIGDVSDARQVILDSIERAKTAK
jgi:inorganic pyrophosphatase